MSTQKATMTAATLRQGPFGGHRGDIQGLRGVAVLLVVLSHVGIEGLAGGYVGVDVFFVISGFLITGLLLKEATESGSVSLSHFYARRARRILPAASLVLFTTVAVTYALLGRVRLREMVEDTVWTALFAANWKFARDGTDYFTSGLPPSPLQHYWSLAVEEQFYVVWPAVVGLAVLGLRRTGRNRTSGGAGLTRVLLVTLAVTTLISFAYSVITTEAAPTLAYFSTLTRAWELSVGAAVAVAASRLRAVPQRAKSFAGWIGVLGICVSAVLFDEQTPFPGTAALLPVVAAALVLAAGMDGPRYGSGGLLAWAPLRWLGDRSYSFYLWHWPFLVIGSAYARRPTSLAENAGLALAALLVAAATYSWVESPLHRGRALRNPATALLLWPASVAVMFWLVISVSGQVTDSAPAPAGFASAQAAPEEGMQGRVPETGDVVAEAVGGAVRAARAGAAVPGSLAPPLTGARSDAWSREARCTADEGQTTHAVCPEGSPSASRLLLVFGDSHAGMWLPPLRRIAAENGWTIYPFIKYGCTPVAVTLFREGAPDEECVQWRAWALREMAALDPDAVIMSSRAGFAFAGDDARQLADEQASLAYEEGVASSIAEVKRFASRAIFFSATPVSPQDPVLCLDAPGAKLLDCMFEPPPSTLRANAILGRAAGQAGGEFIDLMPWFCAEGQCPAVVDQMVVYFDPGHITSTYGRALAEPLEAALVLR